MQFRGCRPASRRPVCTRSILSASCFGFNRVPVEIKRLKFKNVVVPPAILKLSLTRVTEVDVMFAYVDAGRQCSEGRLLFPGMTQ